MSIVSPGYSIIAYLGYGPLVHHCRFRRQRCSCFQLRSDCFSLNQLLPCYRVPAIRNAPSRHPRFEDPAVTLRTMTAEHALKYPMIPRNHPPTLSTPPSENVFPTFPSLSSHSSSHFWFHSRLFLLSDACVADANRISGRDLIIELKFCRRFFDETSAHQRPKGD